MTLSDIQVRLIGAKNTEANAFDFDVVVSVRAATPRRCVQHKQIKQRAKETKAQAPMLEVGEGEED